MEGVPVADDIILFHRSMLGGVLKMGVNVEGARGGVPVFTEFEAWIDLSSSPFVSQVIPGFGNNALSVTWNGGRVHDVAYAWNWKPRRTLKWLTSLLECELICDELHRTLSEAIHVPRKERAARDSIPKSARAAVLAKTSGKCVYCGVRLVTKAGEPNSYQPDHVLPVVLGGSDDIANLVPSCLRCNSAKRAKTLVAFKGVSDE